MENDKPVIFFVHGIGGDADAWYFVRSVFLDRGYRSITMDLRGHGYSDHPKSSHSYQIENLLLDIVSILNEEKVEKIILIGHSYGAVICAYFAIAYPQYLQKLV